MKARAVIVSPRAKADLQWIYDTVEAVTDPATALRYVERLAASAGVLNMAENAAPVATMCGLDCALSASSAGSPSPSSWNQSTW